MIDRRIIDEIRATLDAKEFADRDFIAEALAEYSEACADVNDRLRHAGDLLRKGLRGEAIQEAEREPNLLDLVELLDFPELSQLHELLRSWGMVFPPDLELDVAAELNEAYSEYKPLERLLQQHRLLALSRGRLVDRVAVLQKIFELDSANPAWQADLEIYEAARFEEMSEEARQYLQAGDLAKLASLAGEISRASGVVQPNPALVNEIDTYRRRLVSVRDKEKIGEAAVALNDAFGSMDFEAGVKAREQWGRLLPTANLSSEDRLFDHAQPALDWLAEEERLQRENVEFESAVRDLELAIDNDEGSSKVEQTLYAMRKFPHDIPKKLDIRCQRYLATKQAASRRRIIFIAATTALCIFLVAGMAIWIALMSRHQQALAAAETRITKLVQGEFYEDAVEFYETLDASLRDSTVVNEQKLIAERELDSRQDQLDAFSSAFGDIATDLKPPSDLSEYSADELKGLRAQLVGLQRRLRDTESLVSTPAHQTQFSKLRAEFSERENAIQTAFDLLFQEKLNSYASRITQYKSAKDEASLKQVVAELAALEQANPDASHGLTQQIKPVIRDVESYLTKAQANLSEREKLSDITQSVGDINQFSSTLKRYAASYPTSPVSRSLDRLLTEQKLWSSVKTWSDFYKSPVFSGEGAFLNITPSGASSLVSKGDKLVASLDQMPLANSYLQRKPYLESVGARNPAGQADLVSKISVELNSPLLSEKLQIVTKKSGARFYCSSDNIRRSGNQRVLVYYAPDDDGGISTKRVGFFETELEGVRPAPQAALALKLKGSVQKLQTGNADWEEEFGNMLVAVLEAKDVDDVHRIILLDILAQAGLKGSSLLFDEIYPLTEKALTFATLCRDKPWYDSTNEEIPALRGRASQILNAIPPLQSNLKSALSQRAKLATPISSNYKWVGWLNSVGGDWVGEVKDANTDGALFVIYLASASGEPRLDVVGQVAAGKAVIDASRDESLFVGRPLFVMPKNVANNASNGAE